MNTSVLLLPLVRMGLIRSLKVNNGDSAKTIINNQSTSSDQSPKSPRDAMSLIWQDLVIIL